MENLNPLESIILTGVEITANCFFGMLDNLCKDLEKSHQEFIKNQHKQLV